jgi:beta-N-acetylhexosaminidase
MRRRKKNHVIKLVLVAVIAFLLTIWFIKPFGSEQEVDKVSQGTQEDTRAVQEKNTEKQVSQNNEDEKKATEAPKTADQNMTIDEKVASIMADMTLEEKIGQLMVVGFQSSEVDEHITKMIEDYHVGGVILYDRNMVNPKQVAQLTNDLQGLAEESSEQDIPLMISVDQEGGSIVRMKEHVSPIPSQQELGKRGDSEEIFATAKRTGEELAAMGIHVNYAPVLDLSSTDKRSFGLDQEKAYQFGKQVIAGLSESRVTGAVKHFPGNGRTNIDPHVESSSVTANQMDLENNDIYPFKKMIETVDNNQFFVMVTHIKYPAYDPEKPASISPVIIQDLLRKKLGYTGLVVTDDLEMGAVSKYFTYQDLGYEAIKAGADVLLVCHTLENQDQVYKGVLNAVQSGNLSEDQINEAVERILKYKLTNTYSTQVDPDKAEEIVG